MTEALAMPTDYHAGRPWTIDEVLAMPDDGMRHELIDQNLVVSMVPPPLHQNAGQRLIRILYAAAPIELEVCPETNLKIGDDLLIPDVMVARSEALNQPGSLHVTPKDVVFVAEILSKSNTTFERAWKSKRYAEGGIPFYAEVTLTPLPRVVCFELRGRGYVEVADAHAGEWFRLSEPFEVEFDPAELTGPRR
jgi:Uma2 family endonuclease